MKNVSIVIGLLIFMLFGTSSYGLEESPIPSVPVLQSANVFVHITAVKNTPKGLTAQIDGFTAQGKAGDKTLKVRLEIQGKRLKIELDPKGPKVAQLTMPAGYEIPKAIARKLGATSSVVMSGGSTMVKQESKAMLWFEIQ